MNLERSARECAEQCGLIPCKPMCAPAVAVKECGDCYGTHRIMLALRAAARSALVEAADGVELRDLFSVPLDCVHGIKNRAVVAMWCRDQLKDAAKEIRRRAEEVSDA